MVLVVDNGHMLSVFLLLCGEIMDCMQQLLLGLEVTVRVTRLLDVYTKVFSLETLCGDCTAEDLATW